MHASVFEGVFLQLLYHRSTYEFCISTSGVNQEPVPSTLTQHVSLPKRNKPTPKPRSLKSMPTQTPIQETEGTVSELLHPSVENRSKSRHKPREYSSGHECCTLLPFC